MFRKRRQPAPNFKIPGQPFNPATGQHAILEQYPNKGTTLAMFQVVANDTHDNYVACRGYEADNDPYFRYLHDPHTAAATTPINVAKPYSLRGTFPYVVGQVIVAARIKGKLGYNQGKGVTVGQPADLDEAISLLTDAGGKSIAWLDVSGQGNDWTALAHPTGTIAASPGENFTSGLYPYSNLQTGTARIVAPVPNGANYRFDLVGGATGDTIVNGTPFQLTTNDVLVVRRSRGVWWVERFWSRGPHFTGSLGGSLASTANQLTFGITAQVGNCWQLQTSSYANDNLKYICPVTDGHLPWLVNGYINVTADLTAAGLGYNLGCYLDLVSVETGVSVLRTYSATGYQIPGGNSVFLIPINNIIYPSQNDVIGGQVVFTGTLTVANFSGHLTMTPLF